MPAYRERLARATRCRHGAGFGPANSSARSRSETVSRSTNVRAGTFPRAAETLQIAPNSPANSHPSGPSDRRVAPLWFQIDQPQLARAPGPQVLQLWLALARPPWQETTVSPEARPANPYQRRTSFTCLVRPANARARFSADAE